MRGTYSAGAVEATPLSAPAPAPPGLPLNQVLMDVLGVAVTCACCHLVLDQLQSVLPAASVVPITLHA